MEISLPESWPYPAYLALVGSRAYGLNNEDSDYDYRGFYIAPPEHFWRMSLPREQYHSPSVGECNDITLWELGKFVGLCCAGNPAVLEVLFSPTVIVNSTVGQWLLENRREFLSRKVSHTYKGYAASQIHKSERDSRREGGDVRPKNLMQCLRILKAGRRLLETGEMVVEVTSQQDRDLLLGIREGRVPIEEAQRLCEEMFQSFDSYVENSPLPETPNMRFVDDLLVCMRKSIYNSKRGVSQVVESFL